MKFSSSSVPVRLIRRRAVIRLACLVLVVFTCSYSHSDKKISVLFVASKSTADYIEVIDNAKRQLETQNPADYKFNTKFLSSETNLKNDLPTTGSIVTIGTTAANAVFSLNPKVPLLSVLITENAFLVLAKKHYGSVENAFAAQVSSIGLDQPVTRSIQLARLLVADISEVGVMLGPASVSRQAELIKYIVASDLNPQLVTITAKDNPIHKIEPVLSRSDVFIPISDSRLINIATAKWILHLSYRHKVPVIAFSKSYIKAGALAAVYSSPLDVSKDAADWLLKSQTATVGGLYKPSYYSLNFNKSVAANLKIKLKSEQFYRDQFSQGAK
jgi:putative tryptophan/tyrosine transport system substrate-binding protein